MDASSTKVLRHKLLPRKDVDDAGNVYGVDFTCQQVREQIALAILEVQRRPRLIYVDNGSQFGLALAIFLDLLTADDEEPTRIIHTDPGDPRGRGIVERALGLINSFIQYKPGFFVEKSYRAALRKKKSFNYYEFSFLEGEFEHFIPIRNAKVRGEKPSPDQRYTSAPDEGLTPPDMLQLGLFAGAIERINDRIPSREGVQYKRKGAQYKTHKYVPVSDDPAIGVALATASMNHQETPTMVITFKDFVVLYVKLPDGRWIEMIEEDKRNWSVKKRREWKKEVLRLLDQDENAASARLQAAVVDDLGRKLIVDSFQEDGMWYEPTNGTATSDGADENYSDLKTNPSKSNGRGKRRSSGTPTSTTTQKNRQNSSANTSSKGQRVSNQPEHAQGDTAWKYVPKAEDEDIDVSHIVLGRIHQAEE